MKTILTEDKAIEAYEKIQASYSYGNIPKVCGYFVSDDYEGTGYDPGTIVAFDSTSGDYYEYACSSIDDAIEFIER